MPDNPMSESLLAKMRREFRQNHDKAAARTGMAEAAESLRELARQPNSLGYRYKVATIPMEMAEAIISAHPEMAELIRISEGNASNTLLAQMGNHVVEDERHPLSQIASTATSRPAPLGPWQSGRNSAAHPGQQQLPMGSVHGIPIVSTEHLPGEDSAIVFRNPDGSSGIAVDPATMSSWRSGFNPDALRELCRRLT